MNAEMKRALVWLALGLAFGLASRFVMDKKGSGSLLGLVAVGGAGLKPVPGELSEKARLVAQQEAEASRSYVVGLRASR